MGAKTDAIVSKIFYEAVSKANFYGFRRERTLGRRKLQQIAVVCE